MVFEPEALRVSQVTGSLGGPANGPVLAATSDRHVVTIPLDASQRVGGEGGGRGDRHAAGRDEHAGHGLLGGHGGDHSGSGEPDTTIPVQVTLTDPRAAGTLDQAPVTVNITTASAPGPVLAVPVTALLAQSPGGYVVEVAGPGNTRR